MAAPDGPADHRAYEEMAVAHVMGGLDQPRGHVFRAHLLECGDCRALVGELRAIAHDLAGVEQDEQRERAAKAVELAEREDTDDELDIEGEARRWRRVRLIGLVGVVGFVLLASYTFTLRSGYEQLGELYDQRLEASAALELGEDLPVAYTAAGVNGTAKRNGDDLVLLMEGLRDDQSYGLYLIGRDREAREVTVNRDLQEAKDGRIFVLSRLQGSEEELLVTEVGDSFTSNPSGQTVFEAAIPGE